MTHKPKCKLPYDFFVNLNSYNIWIEERFPAPGHVVWHDSSIVIEGVGKRDALRCARYTVDEIWDLCPDMAV